jgi:Holliday junction DNA helicase RuvB
MTANQDYFPAVVGQETPKRILSLHLNIYEDTSIFPHTLLVAPKGFGKTMFAKSIGANLVSRQTGKPKDFFEISCASIRNLTQFYNSVLLPYCIDKEVTLFLDEASELPKDVTMALLTMLNPNKENSNLFIKDDLSFTCDFRKHTFLFATTESHKIFHALADRLERIELEEYTHDQLGRIIVKNLEKDFVIDDKALFDASSVLRGNARAAQKLARCVNDFIKYKHQKSFSMDVWQELKAKLGLRPLGLSQLELQVLKTLRERGPCSLTQMSSVTQMSRKSLQSDVELFLLKHGLMKIDTDGRGITQKGVQYLENLK